METRVLLVSGPERRPRRKREEEREIERDGMG
jgi:hypothetical protein